MIYSIYQTSWGKEIKCKACQAFCLFFETSLMNSIIQENECLIDVSSLILYIPVNSYGDVGMVSSPNHTFFLGKLD